MSTYPCHGATQTVTNDDCVLAERLRDSKNLLCESPSGVSVPMVTISSATHIHRSDFVFIDKSGRDEVPPVSMCRMAMNEQESWFSFLIIPALIVDAGTGDRYPMIISC